MLAEVWYTWKGNKRHVHAATALLLRPDKRGHAVVPTLKAGLPTDYSEPVGDKRQASAARRAMQRRTGFLLLQSNLIQFALLKV